MVTYTERNIVQASVIIYAVVVVLVNINKYLANLWLLCNMRSAKMIHF
jgi:hypothetical protein